MVGLTSASTPWSLRPERHSARGSYRRHILISGSVAASVLFAVGRAGSFGKPVPPRSPHSPLENYNDNDITELLDLASNILPVAGKGWEALGGRHRRWAKKVGCPERSNQSLETKFKQVRVSSLDCNHLLLTSWLVGPAVEAHRRRRLSPGGGTRSSSRPPHQ